MIVDDYLNKAITSGTSDMHFEPSGKFLRVRFRVDGTLRDVGKESLDLLDNIISRIKILAKLDIAEKRLPQDGSFQMYRGDEYLDIRVSVFPTNFGECAVLRILDHTKLLFELPKLGLLEQQSTQVEKLIREPNGMLLVTGPTGVGKTTTLFSVLNRLNVDEKSIVTLEDPIEYQLPNIRQTQIDPKIGLTFALGLRSLFRQNPDIILVGEIRDRETAEIAVQAGISGHLVLSTFHTNDTFGTIVRLLEMDVENFLIGSSLKGVIAQRLVKQVCSDCKTSYQPPEQIIKELHLENETPEFVKGTGCQTCNNTGYAGRVGVFEVLTIDENLVNLILSKASHADIRNTIYNEQFFTLRKAGLEKVRTGETTVEEIYRVLSIR